MSQPLAQVRFLSTHFLVSDFWQLLNPYPHVQHPWSYICWSPLESRRVCAPLISSCQEFANAGIHRAPGTSNECSWVAKNSGFPGLPQCSLLIEPQGGYWMSCHLFWAFCCHTRLFSDSLENCGWQKTQYVSLTDLGTRTMTSLLRVWLSGCFVLLPGDKSCRANRTGSISQ